MKVFETLENTVKEHLQYAIDNNMETTMIDLIDIKSEIDRVKHEIFMQLVELKQSPISFNNIDKKLGELLKLV